MAQNVGQQITGKLRFIGRLPVTSRNRTQPQRWIVTGITKDRFGVALPGCMVELFETASNVLRAITTSDANGIYTMETTVPPLQFQVTAYLPGSPDVAGITVNTLTSVPG